MLSTIFKFLSGDAMDSLVGLFKDYQDKKLSKEELKFRLETFEATNTQELKLAQVELNAKEAQHHSMFVAGWRPFLGWICGLGFAMNFLVAPVGTFIAATAGYPEVTFPQADVSTMMPILLGMLGLGGFRTFEKVKDKERNKL
jgi:hypothetical protein